MKIHTLRIATVAALCGLILGGPAVYAKKGEKEGAGVRAGILTCEISGGAGFVFGSTKSLRCHFEGENGKAERYVGNINKYGIDVGVTGPATMTWAVIAPTSKIGNGALAGTYVGASAEATAGVGGGAHLLVGGSDKTISLQPLSVQGQTGVNAALTVSELVLDRA